MKLRITLISLLALLVLGGCASIPKQAPILSEELGVKLNTIEKSHLNLLHSFFNQKREIVDEFIIKEWIPTFAAEFFKTTKVSAAWDEIVRSDNKEARLKFIVLLGPSLQTKINQKRLELIKPLDELEKEIQFKITTEYSVAKSLNNSVTSFLYSASKVDENRSRYIEMLGATDERITNALNSTDDIVNQLVKGGEVVVEKEPQAESYIKKIKEIKEKLTDNLK